jgi:hypothetical protein
LKSRNRQIKEKKLLGKDEVYHGALEDILLGKGQGNLGGGDEVY